MTPSGRRRRSRRDRQHRDAHADTETLAPVSALPGVPTAPATLVTDVAGLTAAVDHLSSHDCIAFDTEFIGEETYYPQVCLIQVGTTEAVFLIDPMAVSDLTNLWAVIADEQRTTLVHAGRQDLQILARDLGRMPRTILDTQVLAGFAGLPWPCALSKTIKSVLGVTVPPGMTFTAWDARPLSNRQLRYAADDVRYLPAVYERLRADITDRGHWAWAQAACAVFDDPAWYEADVNNQQRKLEGSRRFKPTERSILRRLIEARDAVARRDDTPPRATIPDNALIAMVRERPGTIEALGGVRGMPRPVAKRHGDALLKAIQQGRDDDHPPVRVGHDGNESPHERMLIDGLWGLFCAACVHQRIAPTLILSRNDMAAWMLGDRTDKPGRTPWQQEIAHAILDPLRADTGTLGLQWTDRQVTQTRIST